MERLRAPDSRRFAWFLAGAVGAQFLVYSQTDWRAGHSWGPRYLTDVLPILTWLLVPGVRSFGVIAKITFTGAIAVSVGIQMIGAFWYTHLSDEKIFAEPGMHGAWNPQNTPFVVELGQKRVPGDLLRQASGAVDKVGSSRVLKWGPAPVLEPGSTVEGWINTGPRAPAQVFVLIDGIIVGGSQDFHVSEENHAAKNGQPHFAWRITANTLGVSLGERVLQLAVRIDARGSLRIIREQTVNVAPPPLPASPPAAAPAKSPDKTQLAAMATRAAALIREHQRDDGYWLTAHTQKPRYEGAQQEMNTFLTAALIDFLAPVSSHQRLDYVLERARNHLTAQIEDTGLVRYHGRLDGPAIGKYGYPITPDSDDTALAWRISGRGPDDPKFQSMMDILATYRDARGFYRTWLAPEKDYVNLNPGLDPNPTDIGIQINIALMLHHLAPSSAWALYQSLRQFRDDGDLWVYYSKAPLLPYLRMAELRDLGYAIQLPSERLALPVPGQEIWSHVAMNLAERHTPSTKDGNSGAIELLQRLARDDFSEIRVAPPLLYHNDQSATVERYYWSEDFGYALWLLLYERTLADAGSRKLPTE